MTGLLRRNCCSSELFSAHVSLPRSIAKQTQASYTLLRILCERYLLVRTCKSFLKFPQVTSGSNGTVTAPTGAQHISLVAESGLHIKHGAPDIHFSHSPTIDGPRITITPTADVVWVSRLLPSDTTALLVDLQHVLWALDEVVSNTTTADSTWVHARFHGQHQRPRT